MWQALLISIWQLPAILLPPLKLCQVGWGVDAHFRLLQKYLIGFKLRLWLGHSRIFTELPISHSYCVLGPLSLLEDKPSARLRFWMLWTGFSSLYFGAWDFLLLWRSPSVPATEKEPHSIEAATAHFTFGMVFCRWRRNACFSFKHDAWNWGSSDQIIFFLTFWGSFRFFFANSNWCFHVSTLKRGLSFATQASSPDPWSVAVMFVLL